MDAASVYRNEVQDTVMVAKPEPVYQDLIMLETLSYFSIKILRQAWSRTFSILVACFIILTMVAGHLYPSCDDIDIAVRSDIVSLLFVII